MESKPLLEIALAEHDKVRLAMESIAKDLQHEAEEQSRLSLPSPPLAILASEPSASGLSIPAGGDNPDASTTSAPETTVALDSSGTTIVTESVDVATDPLRTQEVGAQTEVSGPPPPTGLDPGEVSKAVAVAAKVSLEEKEKAVSEAEARGMVAGRADAVGWVSKMLKLLHVASRFEAKGERLPTAVDFFSKVCCWSRGGVSGSPDCLHIIAMTVHFVLAGGGRAFCFAASFDDALGGIYVSAIELYFSTRSWHVSPLFLFLRHAVMDFCSSSIALRCVLSLLVRSSCVCNLVNLFATSTSPQWFHGMACQRLPWFDAYQWSGTLLYLLLA